MRFLDLQYSGHSAVIQAVLAACYVQSLQTAALIVNPPPTATQVVSADPDDDPVVATAVHGQAEVLCTRDRHLHSPAVKTYCSNHGIQVLTDIEVLQILRAAASPPAPLRCGQLRLVPRRDVVGAH